MSPELTEDRPIWWGSNQDFMYCRLLDETLRYINGVGDVLMKKTLISRFIGLNGNGCKCWGTGNTISDMQGRCKTGDGLHKHRQAAELQK